MEVGKSPVRQVILFFSTWYQPKSATLIQTAANVAPDKFPEPKKVKTDRPVGKYIHYGWGTHSCFGAQIANIGLTAMLRCFARLPNLRRAPGPEGQLKYVVVGLFRAYMTEDWSNYSYWPTGTCSYIKS
jgi:cytochrome P450